MESSCNGVHIVREGYEGPSRVSRTTILSVHTLFTSQDHYDVLGSSRRHSRRTLDHSVSVSNLLSRIHASIHPTSQDHPVQSHFATSLILSQEQSAASYQESIPLRYCAAQEQPLAAFQRSRYESTSSSYPEQTSV